VVEFALGIEGYPFQHEWPLYVFEAVPMLFAIGILAWFHPVLLIQEDPRGAFEAGSDDGQLKNTRSLEFGTFQAGKVIE
jgi:RTA1 like protein